MAKTKIEYGERTWNPLAGCTIKSEGCVNCWAKTMAKRLRAMGRPEYQDVVDDAGNWTGKITLIPSRLDEPYHWRDPQHVLVEYMGDLFHDDVEADFIYHVFRVMAENPQHTFQVLTKRASNMEFLLFEKEPLRNVILGVSVENQKRADERRENMRILAEHGWRTWVSYGPALGRVKWDGWEFIEQMVCEGESGPRARPMHPYWARSARKFCQRNGIRFFFKQWGKWMPIAEIYDDDGADKAFKYLDYWIAQVEPDGSMPVLSSPIDEKEDGWCEYQPCPGSWFMAKVGKKRAGRLLDGREWNEMPPSAEAAFPHLGGHKMGEGSE